MRRVMGTYSLGQGQQITVYSFQNGVYLRRWSGKMWGRPQLLAEDCMGDFSDVFWRETVYYGYRNQRGEYLVRDGSLPDKKYVLQPGESMRICCPRLLLHREKLMVFYIEEREWEGGCALRGIYVGEGKKTESLGEYERRPDFQVLQWGEELLVGVAYGGVCRYYRWCAGDAWEELAGWEYWWEARQEELAGQQCQSREEIELLQQDLKYSQELIESIKGQYQELMDTATQYREEARKWRSQYIAACGGEGKAGGKRAGSSLFSAGEEE